jgi:hypothetical protein
MRLNPRQMADPASAVPQAKPPFSGAVSATVYNRVYELARDKKPAGIATGGAIVARKRPA